MKPLAFLILIHLCCRMSLAGEYRYHLMATTGLSEVIYDDKGKETTIVMSGESDAKARFVLQKILELEGVSGTKTKELFNGVPYEQAIILKGELKPEILRTPTGAGLPQPENYQHFVLKEVQVRFPLVRSRAGKQFDTGFLETHFSFDTLFPEGLEFAGEKIDFANFTDTKK